MGELAAIDSGVLGSSGVSTTGGPSVGPAIDVGTAAQLAAALAAPSSIQFTSPAVLMVRNPGGAIVGTVTGMLPKDQIAPLPLADFLAQYGMTLGYAYGGFTIHSGGRAGSVAGYFQGMSRDVTVGAHQLDATLTDLGLIDGDSVSAIPEGIAALIEGFKSSVTGVTATIAASMQPLGLGVLSAATGAPICNADQLANFWSNKPSFFSQEFLGHTTGIASWRRGIGVLPYTGLPATVNFTGALVNNPNMPLLAVTASGYCFALDSLGHDPINVFDPATNAPAVAIGFVQMLVYDGCRQFSANAPWGYKGAQPTDRLTLSDYQNSAFNPGGTGAAGNPEGPH